MRQSGTTTSLLKYQMFTWSIKLNHTNANKHHICIESRKRPRVQEKTFIIGLPELGAGSTHHRLRSFSLWHIGGVRSPHLSPFAWLRLNLITVYCVICLWWAFFSWWWRFLEVFHTTYNWSTVQVSKIISDGVSMRLISRSNVPCLHLWFVSIISC